MKYNQLGDSAIKVSELCLGSMTWGSQNTQKETNEQIDISLDHGVNFVDTAEMYPTTPRSSQTHGKTEEMIGKWNQSSKKRNKIILATKITGKGYSSIREGEPISKNNLRIAMEGSLRRLKTDYIDLYQLHWANRGSYHFRQNWNYDPSNQNTKKEIDDFQEILEEFNKFILEGKIRTIGLSNETAWGTMQYINASKKFNLPKVVSIQNEYSLLCRLFDLDMAELCHHENIGLLSFSPLACGILSGKYLNNNIPLGSRKSIYNDLGQRSNELVFEVTQKYINLSKQFNLDPCQMSLSFCISRPFMTSVIFGATTKKQLINNLNSININLNNELMEEIKKIFKTHPSPF